MRVRIKLTTLSDKDLLTLNSIPEFDFRNWLRETLVTYANTGEIRKVSLPVSPSDKPVLKNIMFSINFDQTKDVAVVELFSAVQNRLRSGLIKSILRCSLSRPCLYSYFDIYPAPFPVIKPERLNSAEGSDVAISTSTVSNPPVASEEQASGGAPDGFNIFDFDDQIK